MDVEKTIEFLLEQQAASQARFDAGMAEIREQISAINGTLAKVTDEQLMMRRDMRRAVHVAVQEARAERRRRRKGDEELAALQAETERKLQRLIDSIAQSRNGHDKP